MEKLQNEVRAVGQGKSEITEDDFDKMQYLKLVIKEILRLHSPVPSLVWTLSWSHLVPAEGDARVRPLPWLSMNLHQQNYCTNLTLPFPDGGKPEDMDMTEAGGIVVHRKLPILVVATPYSP
ncbi:unnamed protein product [Coffea canephora]|uniref:DH200=94 genomic scaffold, scaffold_1214 n=1 Tax=Coffea canephora TaxID=49390 RepID=A0A068VIL2_COFCA|nr:unnamed protein product [Coffea canephora]